MIYTIQSGIEYEIIIKKSRFIISLVRINKEDDILEEMIKVKEKYKNATHYCYAYIIGNRKRFNDDKEPNGTAGIPILEVLEKNNLNYILCIVTRYFGGIKLGASGLVRAYSNGVVEALNMAKIIPLVEGKQIILKFDYTSVKQIDNILKEITITDKRFDETITYNIEIELSQIDNLKEKLSIIPNIQIEELNNILIEKTSN